jgi:hypothetical protein
MIAVAWLALLALAPVGDRPTDLVLLKNGKTLTGHVVYRDESHVVLMGGSRERKIEMAEVERVDCVLGALDQVLDQLELALEHDVPGLLELARFCRDQRLPGESTLLAWAVLSVDPKNAQAHELLGHKQRGERWFVKDGASSVTFDERTKRALDFGDGWHFQTTHYDVRTNLPLTDAVGIALDLERLYRDVQDFLGPELELHDVLTPMEAAVYADDASFPELTGGRRSYFRSDTRTLFVNAVGGLDRWTLVHEAVHQVLYSAGAGSRAGRTSMPAWLDEGLAEYIAAGAQGDRGRLVARPGAVAVHHFRAHADEKDPFDLSRVLSFDVEDFLASSKVPLKYAQCYTLVHFLLHAENQRYRPGFMAFLRSCWNGHSSSTAFKGALDYKPSDLEEAWIAYVRENL